MGISIKKEELASLKHDFLSSRANQIAMNAVTTSGVKEAATRWTAKQSTIHEYYIRTKHKGITNQKSSGRCWMFAALNCLRFQVIQKLNLKDFELSQNYICFYDKLEKSNYFLESILETLDELMESTKEYKSLDEWLGFTQDYTEKLKREQQKQNQPETDSISVFTLHASKGLEYDIVIIPDVNEGLIPYKKAVLEAELEEERRMLYVGMTRTKKELFLSYVKNIRSRQAQPSVFLTELL